VPLASQTGVTSAPVACVLHSDRWLAVATWLHFASNPAWERCNSARLRLEIIGQEV
jgi:hypothetical protein